MMDILNNEQVQAALIALIVVALNALAQWVRSKVSYTKIVDDYWCYSSLWPRRCGPRRSRRWRRVRPTHPR
jgi:hypothetical protein